MYRLSNQEAQRVGAAWYSEEGEIVGGVSSLVGSAATAFLAFGISGKSKIAAGGVGLISACLLADGLIRLYDTHD